MRLTPASLARHSPCALTVKVGRRYAQGFEGDALVLFRERRRHIAELPFAPDQFLGVEIDGRNGARIGIGRYVVGAAAVAESAASATSATSKCKSVELQIPGLG